VEPFSLACTTCRSRLKVRDERIIGHILPCPRCGSMVLIERPAVPADAEDPALPPSASISYSQVLQDLPPRDSFDHIDRLFDEPLRLPARTPRGGSRWRVPVTPESQPKAAPSIPAMAAKIASQGDVVAGQVCAAAGPSDGVPTSPADAATSPPGTITAAADATAGRSDVINITAAANHPANTTNIANATAVTVATDSCDNYAADPADTAAGSPGPEPASVELTSTDTPLISALEANAWLNGSAAIVRAYWLMGGAVVVGVALAVGLAGILLSRSTRPELPSDTSALARAEPSQPALGPAEAPAREPAEADPVAAEPPVVAPDEPTAEGPSQQEPTPAAPAPKAARETDADQPPPVAPQAPAEEGPAPLPPTTPTPTTPPAPAPSRDAVPPVPVPVADAESPVPDDELASFARWLQDMQDTSGSPTSSSPTSPPITPPDAAIAAATTIPSSMDRAEPADPVSVQPTRSPPPLVEVEVRLREEISALKLDEVPLHQALRFLTELTTIPIRLEPEALGRYNLRADQPVSLLTRGTRVNDVLDEILGRYELGYEYSAGHLEVRTASDARGEMTVLRHDVTDLRDADPEWAHRLAKWITHLIGPGTWEGQVKRADESALPLGSCTVEESMLVVRHSDAVKYQVIAFCERLRLARGLPAKTRIHEDRIRLGSRVNQFPHFDVPVTIRTSREQSLNEILSELEAQASVELLVDWPALHQAGWSPRDRMMMYCERLPLRDALALLLTDKGLSLRVLDATSLEVTTPAVLAITQDLEFYPLGMPEPAAEQVRQLSQQLANQIGMARFQPTGSGAIAYDVASRCLIVSLSQPEQTQASEWIAAWIAARQK
jgi:hypothetical protein